MIEDQDNLIEIEEKLLISLYSYNASSKNNGSNLSDMTFKLQEPYVQDHKVLSANMSILSFTCPNSQYIINDTNNILVIYRLVFDQNFYSTDIYYYVKLINGNYNANTFMTMLISALNTQVSPFVWTMSYDSNTFKYTLTSTTTFAINQFHISPSDNYTKISMIGVVMGFDETYAQAAFSPDGIQPASITFPYPVNFGGLNSININLTNFKTRSLIYKSFVSVDVVVDAFYPNTKFTRSNKASVQNVAMSVPVNCNPGEVIYYQKLGTFEFNLKEELIDHFDVQLTDDLGNLLQLNNQHWNMTIEINLTKVVHKKTRNFFEIINNPFPKVSYIPQY